MPRVAIVVILTTLGCGGGRGSGSELAWVGSWSAAPMCYFDATILGLPRTLQFDDQSVRMVVRTSLGGSAVRVKLTNQCGETPLEIGSATVGIRETGASVQPETLRELRFNDRPSLIIPAGSTATSDPVELELSPQSDLTVTLYLPGETVPTTSHPMGARGYSSGTGDFTSAADGSPFETALNHWVFLDAVEVLAESGAASIFAFGDSVTEGTGTTFDANRRWPDFLARRLIEEAKRIAVNRFIRESGEFDAVIDFAAAVEDPADPSRWRSGLSDDQLHPSDAGAEALAEAVDLSLFR